jgi:hypothetical protein
MWCPSLKSVVISPTTAWRPTAAVDCSSTSRASLQTCGNERFTRRLRRHISLLGCSAKIQCATMMIPEPSWPLILEKAMVSSRE